MVDCHHFEQQLNRHNSLNNGSIDRHKIRYDDAFAILNRATDKILTFKNQMADGRCPRPGKFVIDILKATQKGTELVRCGS